MNINEFKTALAEGEFNGQLLKLYGETEESAQRYLKLLEGFNTRYPEADEIRIFSAPGRTEIGGNHTDHQHGCVLAAGVQLDVIAAVSLNQSGTVSVTSEGFGTDVISLDDLDKKEGEEGSSVALLRGVCKGFKDKGVELKGFNAYTVSQVPAGSGLSSSAAYEILLCTVLNGLSGAGISEIELAKISQKAEREYFGKPCGLLDQMASAYGGFIFADFKDPENPKVQKLQLDIEAVGYTLCVVNTGGSHADLTDDYAAVTAECKEVSSILWVDYLREADQEQFYANIASIRNYCSDRAVLRAHHFFTENRRVKEQKEVLADGNIKGFLKLVRASGQSSFDYLQNLYSPSNVAEQGLPIGIALTQHFLGDKGACRVHGGGFAGTIQAYIPTDMFDEYKQMIEAVFGEGSCVKLSIRPVGGYELK